jgi:V-type H+-transporting ATPase subunit H
VVALRKADRAAKARRAAGDDGGRAAAPTPDEVAGAAAALAVLRAVTKDDAVQYALASLDDAVCGSGARAVALLKPAPGAPSPKALLQRALARSADWFSQERAASLLGALCAGSDGGADDDAPFVDWALAQLGPRPNHPTRAAPAGVAALAKLLRNRDTRAAIAARGAASLLPRVLRGAAGAAPQAAYDASVAAWLLALTQEGAESLEAAGGAAALAAVLRGGGAKEKVVRAASLALGALLAASPAAGASAVASGAGRAAESLLAQAWEDGDVVEALTAVKDAVAAASLSACSWDAYRAEVLSGRLAWSPPHTSDAFWAAHAGKLDDRGGQLVRVLVRVLDPAAASTPLALAVACSDLARYAALVPHGRSVLADLHGKEAGMRLLAHPDPDVRRHALAAVQGMVLGRDRMQYLNAVGA